MSVNYIKQSQSISNPLAVLELIKPITWFPPMWAYACGVISSGMDIMPNLALIILGIALAGPVVCGMSQAANDWCDRHVDAINQPDRPNPIRSYSRFMGPLDSNNHEPASIGYWMATRYLGILRHFIGRSCSLGLFLRTDQIKKIRLVGSRHCSSLL